MNGRKGLRVAMLRFAHIAVRDVLHYRIRSSLAVSGIAVTVAVFLVLSSVAEGIGNTLSGGAAPARNIILVQKGTFLADSARLPQEMVATAQELVPGSAVAPILYRHFRVDGEIVHLRAVPLESYRVVRDVELLGGQWLQRGNFIAVGESLANQQGWRVGQSLDVGGEPFKVRGIFRAGGAMDAEVWITLEDGQRILNQHDTFSTISIQVPVENDLEGAKAALERDSEIGRLADVFFESTYWDTANRSTAAVKNVIAMVGAIALVAIAFGIFNVSNMTVWERRREIGIFKAIGLSRGAITGIYLLEGLILAGSGYLLGLILGIIAVLYLGSGIALVDLAVRPQLTPTTILLGLGLAALFSIIGSYLPARRAAAAPVAETLREA